MTKGKIVSAVGIAVTGRERAPNDPRGQVESGEILRAMENAVLSAREQGITDPAEVKRLMMESRDRMRTLVRSRPRRA